MTPLTGESKLNYGQPIGRRCRSLPPANGKAPSAQNIRRRIRTHYSGNAEGSTLRKTLGCLLSDQLGIELRRVGSGNRRTFVTGEKVLSEWMELSAKKKEWTSHM